MFERAARCITKNAKDHSSSVGNDKGPVLLSPPIPPDGDECYQYSADRQIDTQYNAVRIPT